MEQNSFHLIEQASEMSKITLSVIVYALCPSKTIIKTNKRQMNSSADTFFLNDPLPYRFSGGKKSLSRDKN